MDADEGVDHRLDAVPRLETAYESHHRPVTEAPLALHRLDAFLVRAEERRIDAVLRNENGAVRTPAARARLLHLVRYGDGQVSGAPSEGFSPHRLSTQRKAPMAFLLLDERRVHLDDPGRSERGGDGDTGVIKQSVPLVDEVRDPPPLRQRRRGRGA